MTRASKAEQLRAGAFVSVGIAVFVAAIFLLGQKSALFSSTTTLFVNLDDVNGLVVGAPVRLAGLEVGTVAAINFPKDLSNKQARVRMVVRTSFMKRIRKDTRAFVDSSGLLGDKLINLSMGDPSVPQLEDGATIAAGETLTFEALSTTLHDAITTVKSLATDARGVVAEVKESHVQEDIESITSSVASILREIERGEGTAHRLIYDRGFAQEVAATLRNTRAISAAAAQAVERVEAVLAEVERGDGGLHEVIYGPLAADTLREVRGVASEVRQVVNDVREGDGLLHTVIYEHDQSSFVKNFDELSATLNRLVSEVDRGRGTLGGLMKDPTVYEDLKTVLGNIKRNVMFKALIRYTIEKDDIRQPEEAPRVRPLGEPAPLVPLRQEGAPDPAPPEQAPSTP